MKFEESFDILTITLDPRIDASNADEVGNEIMSQVKDGQKVQVNAKDLKYISSAGLRVLLKLRKKLNQRYIIFDVSKEVYEILEVTGFTELLDVRKALREMWVEGCEVIGAGGYGTVYRLDEETILKVYHPGISQEFIDGERDASKKAFVLGIPTAIAYDTVRINDQYGVVYEMLNAKTVAQLISADPSSLKELGTLSAKALKDFHQIIPGEGTFPRQKEKYEEWVKNISKYLTEEEVETLNNFLKSIPDTDNFLHGDYNSKNVMVQDGQITLIDIGDASIGHPAFDLAGLIVAYLILPKSTQGPEAIRKLLGFDPSLGKDMWHAMCAAYFDNDDPAFIQEMTATLMPLTNLNIAYQGFNRGTLDEEVAKAKVDGFVRKLLLKSIETAKPINF